MFVLAINSAIALKNALMSLLTVASTATVISATDAVSLLAGTANGRLIAVLRLPATETIAGKSAGVDIKTMIGFINFLCDSVGGDMPLIISAYADDGDGNVMLSLGAKNIGNTQFTSFCMALNEALDHHKIFFNQERIYTMRVGTATPYFSGIVMCMAESFVHKVTMTITDTNVVIGGFDQDITLDHNSCVIAGDLGNVPMQFVLFVVDLFSIVRGKGIYNSDTIWINGSHFAPPMLNFAVPSIGELSFFYV